MSSLGTRTFWRPIGSGTLQNAQIKKQEGYVTVVLTAAHYNSRGNFWQKFFGGRDRITLSTNVTYRHAAEVVQADTIQDLRQVKANRRHYLGINRQIALKLPTVADSLELTVSLTGIKDDGLERALKILNSDEFQTPLELAPPIVGQLLGVGSVVRRMLTTSGPHPHLDASYPGVISTSVSSDPITESRLMKGHIVMISNHDDTDGILDNLDVSKLEVAGDSVRYDGKALDHTYLVYAVSVDPNRGTNRLAPWQARYDEALTRLDEIYGSQGEREAIFSRSLQLWTEGNALLATDPCYLAREACDIRKVWLARLRERLKEIDDYHSSAPVITDTDLVGKVLPGGAAAEPEFLDASFSEIESAARDYTTAVKEAGLVLPFD